MVGLEDAVFWDLVAFYLLFDRLAEGRGFGNRFATITEEGSQGELLSKVG